jgi:DNA polymerase III alpha subunit
MMKMRTADTRSSTALRTPTNALQARLPHLEPLQEQAIDNEEEIKQIIDVSQRLESLPRHSSVHAAGLIVGDKPLIEHIPLQLCTS